MERKAPLTPKARKLNRTIARSTMAPDLSTTVIGGPSRRQGPPSRQSVMPSLPSSQENAAAKSEAAVNDAEIMYLYNTYLQTEAIKLMMKKKIGETEKKNLMKIAALIKEDNEIQEKLSSVRRRVKAVENLSQLQNNVDEQLIKISNLLAVLDKETKTVLKQLESRLETLDVLKCKNITIPQTTDDMNRVRDLLMNCASHLTRMITLIGTQSDVLIPLDKELNRFKSLTAEISECLEKNIENLEQLQISTLKEGEQSLMLIHSNCPNK